MNPIAKRTISALTTAALVVLAIIYAPVAWIRPAFAVLIGTALCFYRTNGVWHVNYALLGAGFIVYKELELERKNKIVRPEDLPYREEVIAAEAAYGVEQPRIYAGIQVESSFIPDAVSKAGAIGLMQMLPSTYEDQCARRGVPCDPEDLCKPEVSIDFCSEYLMILHDLTGSWKWAHIAYSKGGNAVYNYSCPVNNCRVMSSFYF